MTEAAAATLFNKIAEFGPGWLCVAASLVIVWLLSKKLLGIYDDTRRERIDNDREIIRISGQMVEQMDRSNDVIEAVEHQMSVMNETNAQLVKELLHSKHRNERIDDDIRIMKDRIDLMYEREIKRGD